MAAAVMPAVLLGALEAHPLVQRLMSNAYTPTGESCFGSTASYKTCTICDCKWGNFCYKKVGACDHEACKNCLRDWCSAKVFNFSKNISIFLRFIFFKINEGSLEIRCPFIGCKQLMSYKDIKALFTANPNIPTEARLPLMFKRFDDNLLFHSVNLMSDMRFCPVCHVGAFLPQSGNACRSVECRECAFKFCPECVTSAHGDTACTDMDKRSAADAAQLHEARLNEDWKKQHTRRCPQCQVNIQRNDGCSHMTCKQCKYEFCWLCSRKYQGKHVANNATQCSCTGPLP